MAAMVASRNHGKSAKGKKNSVPSMSSQKPCCEMLVTSTAEVSVPSTFEVMEMLLNNRFHNPKLTCRKAMIYSQFNTGFKPKLRFSSLAVHMNMRSRLFT
jgi:hypothetical protein